MTEASEVVNEREAMSGEVVGPVVSAGVTPQTLGPVMSAGVAPQTVGSVTSGGVAPQTAGPVTSSGVARQAAGPTATGAAAAGPAPGSELRRPRVVVLTVRWTDDEFERRVVTRTIAGTLALHADVDVVTAEGDHPSSVADSVFTVHRLATLWDPLLELRRALMLQAMAHTGISSTVPPEARAWLATIDAGLWVGAEDLLRRLRPDLVLAVGPGDTAMVPLLERAAPDVPMVLVAEAADEGELRTPGAQALLRRAAVVLVTTDSEGEAVAAACGAEQPAPGGHARAVAPIHNVGLTLPTSSAVWREPISHLSGRDYVLVQCDSRPDGSDQPCRRAVSALAARFPDNPIAAVYHHNLEIWHNDRCEHLPPITKVTDRWRAMAWARVTVDPQPGRLLGINLVNSLSYGTPVVVPADARAVEHARLGGGLWYRDGAELLAAVELLLARPEMRAQLSRTGSDYASARFGGRDHFVERILASVSPALGGGRRQLTAEQP